VKQLLITLARLLRELVMDQVRLSEWLSLMKQQLASQEVLLEYHFKLEAMVEMMLAKNLIDYPPAMLHDYLWVVNDLIGKAKELNKDLLDLILGVMPSLVASDSTSADPLFVWK
jgi:hypothetical protein